MHLIYFIASGSKHLCDNRLSRELDVPALTGHRFAKRATTLKTGTQVFHLHDLPATGILRGPGPADNLLDTY